MDPTGRDPECKCKPGHDDPTCSAHKQTSLDDGSELPFSHKRFALQQGGYDKEHDGGPAREMTLDEVVSKLPEDHRVRVELDRLRDEIDVAEAINLRAERVQVASRVLAAMEARIGHSDTQEYIIILSVARADALIARIDETG